MFTNKLKKIKNLISGETPPPPPHPKKKS